MPDEQPRTRRVPAGAHEPFLTKREIAALVRMSTRWIEQMHHQGLPSRLIGGRRRYLASEVLRWIENRFG